MKRSNVWRDSVGNLWEVRDGEVGYGLVFYVVFADRTVWSRVAPTTPFRQTVSPAAQEAWEILIGDPLPALRKAGEGAEEVPDTYRDADGAVWARSEGGVRVPLDDVWFVTESGYVVCDGLRRDNRPDWARTCARVREAWAALYPKPTRPDLAQERQELAHEFYHLLDSDPASADLPTIEGRLNELEEHFADNPVEVAFLRASRRARAEVTAAPKKRPRKFRDSDGDVWIRGFKRGEVLFMHPEQGTCTVSTKRGRVVFSAGYYYRCVPAKEASEALAAIAALWPERKSK